MLDCPFQGGVRVLSSKPSALAYDYIVNLNKLAGNILLFTVVIDSEIIHTPYKFKTNMIFAAAYAEIINPLITGHPPLTRGGSGSYQVSSGATAAASMHLYLLQ